MNPDSSVHRSPFSVVLRRLLTVFSLVLLAGVVPATAAQAAKTSNAPAVAPVDGVVNLNTATEKQLTFLPQIGPSKASKIIAYRTKRPFKRIVHLARVRGIGLKTVRRLKRWLTLSGDTTLTKPVKMNRTK